MNHLCENFAQTIGGKVEHSEPDSCTVSRSRDHIQALILGKQAKSVLEASYTYESLDASGMALNTGETPLLQEEVNPFTAMLQRGGILVTAIHNHWLCDDPKLMYIHCESVEPPMMFAAKIAAAWQVLK